MNLTLNLGQSGCLQLSVVVEASSQKTLNTVENAVQLDLLNNNLKSLKIRISNSHKRASLREWLRNLSRDRNPYLLLAIQEATLLNPNLSISKTRKSRRDQEVLSRAIKVRMNLQKYSNYKTLKQRDSIKKIWIIIRAHSCNKK